MTGSHIQTFPFLIRAITPVFSHLSPLFLGSNFASRCYLPCLLLIWQWSLQHDCPQWPLVKSLFTYNWCIQAINDDTQLALIGHVIACIVRKGFPSNRQTVWPQIERLPSAQLGKFCWGGWEQLVLLWADNRSAPGREILPCCCCVDKLYDTAWRSFSPSRAVSVERWYWSLGNIICGRTPVVASRPVCLLLAPQSWALPCGPELDTGRKDCWHAGAY